MKVQRWRPWVVPALVVVVGCALTILIAPAAAPNNTDASSYATGDAGTWALYHLTADLGAKPVRLTGSNFRGELAPGETLVEAAPSTAFSAAQVAAVTSFLRSGGTLVMALGNSSVDRPLLAALNVSTGSSQPAGTWRELAPLGGSRQLLVQLATAPALVAEAPSALPLLGPVAHPVALVQRVGQGLAVVLDSARPLSNAALRNQDDALFAVAALQISPGRTVVFDEIHHGYSLGDGTRALLLGTPLGLVAILCALLLLGYLVSSGRRLGRPLPPAELVSVRTTDDHLDALAQLYLRTTDRRGVAARYLEQLRRRCGFLRREAGGGEPSSSVQLQRLEALWGELEVAAREPVTPSRLRQLAQEADQLEREVEGIAAMVAKEAR